MTIFRLYIILLLVLMTCTDIYSKENEKITIANFRYHNVPESLVEKIQDDIIEYIYTQQNFDFIDSNFISKKFNKKNRKLKSKEIIEIGIRTKVDVIIIGSLSKEKRYKIILEFLDSKSGKPKYISKRYTDNKNKLTWESLSIFNDYAVRYIYPTKCGYYLRGIIPGWSYFYTGEKKKGYIFSIVFATSAIGTFFSYNYFKDKHDQYKSVPKNDMFNNYTDEKDEKYSQSQRAYYIFSGFAVTTLFIYGLNFYFIYQDAPDFQYNFEDLSKGISFIKNKNNNIYVNVENYFKNNRASFKSELVFEYKF